MAEEKYDAIVIGAGQGALPFSAALARAGWKTALIERAHVGGTCINTGCTPTKTMVASARVEYLARRAGDFGVEAGTVKVDMLRVRQRKRDIVTSYRASTERRTQNPGEDLIRGEARFIGPHTLEVRLNESGTRQLTAEKIFINTGDRSARPNLPGLDRVPSLDSTSIMELGQLPEHLLVLGGGYVGLEFAQMFRRFGSQVTIVQRSGQLLSHEDEDVAEAVAEILREDGIEVLLKAEAVVVSPGEEQAVQLKLRLPGGERVICGSHLLVATGRQPNTEALNLSAAGVKTDDNGYILVNDRLETNVSGIYAMGDVKGGPAFTHISYDDYRILRDNLLKDGHASIQGRMVPYVVFIDPQLGRVGMTESEARQAGRNIRIAKIPMSYISRAVEVAEDRGLMKAVIDADTREILGFAALSVEGGELMAIVEVAMLGHLPYTILKDATFAHPTLSEGLNTLFMVMDGD